MSITLRPHGEERRVTARPEAWPQARWPPPSFETPAARAPQDEGDVLSVHRHRGEIHEPAFRLHEVLDLRRHRARPNVVRDPEERRFVDRTLMQGGERLVARGRLEGDTHRSGELVVLRIVDEAPVVRDRPRQPA